MALLVKQELIIPKTLKYYGFFWNIRPVNKNHIFLCEPMLVPIEISLSDGMEILPENALVMPLPVTNNNSIYKYVNQKDIYCSSCVGIDKKSLYKEHNEIRGLGYINLYFCYEPYYKRTKDHNIFFVYAVDTQTEYLVLISNNKHHFYKKYILENEIQYLTNKYECFYNTLENRFEKVYITDMLKYDYIMLSYINTSGYELYKFKISYNMNNLPKMVIIGKWTS